MYISTKIIIIAWINQCNDSLLQKSYKNHIKINIRALWIVGMKILKIINWHFLKIKTELIHAREVEKVRLFTSVSKFVNEKFADKIRKILPMKMRKVKKCTYIFKTKIKELIA